MEVEGDDGGRYVCVCVCVCKEKRRCVCGMVPLGSARVHVAENTSLTRRKYTACSAAVPELAGRGFRHIYHINKDVMND